MTVKLLTEQHLEFLNLKGGCTGSSESTFVKMTHCWKYVAAQTSCILFQQSQSSIGGCLIVAVFSKKFQKNAKTISFRLCRGITIVQNSLCALMGACAVVRSYKDIKILVFSACFGEKNTR